MMMCETMFIAARVLEVTTKSMTKYVVDEQRRTLTRKPVDGAAETWPLVVAAEPRVGYKWHPVFKDGATEVTWNSTEVTSINLLEVYDMVGRGQRVNRPSGVL